MEEFAGLDAAVVAHTEAPCETGLGQPDAHSLVAPHAELLQTAFTCLVIAPPAYGCLRSEAMLHLRNTIAATFAPNYWIRY